MGKLKDGVSLPAAVLCDWFWALADALECPAQADWPPIPDLDHFGGSGAATVANFLGNCRCWNEFRNLNLKSRVR